MSLRRLPAPLLTLALLPAAAVHAQQRAVWVAPVPALPSVSVPAAPPGLASPGALSGPTLRLTLPGYAFGAALPELSPAPAVGPAVAAGPATAARPAVLGAGSLIAGRWVPENRERLERLIRLYGRGGPRWDPDHPPLATFDWDNTVIRNDIGEAVFYHAIREMRFKFELGDRFWNQIPEHYGRAKLRASWQALAGLPTEQAKRTPEYRRYRKLFHAMYERIKREGASIGVDYGWLVQLMVGFTEAELERLADEVIALETSRPLGFEQVSEGDADPDPRPVPTGVRVYPEMADLIRQLTAAGWEVRVVSATAEPIVARFAARVGVPRDRVHGARARISSGKLTDELVQRTWGQGKADAILREAGRASLLAGGDSNSDREMLELSRGERLVIDLGKEPLHGAAAAGGWLLQPPFPPAVSSP